MLIKSSSDSFQKLLILTQGARYDVSCATSGVDRKALRGKLGNAHLPGLCHSWSSDGRCISLLKTLMTNECVNNCAYCINRCKNDVQRTAFVPDELARLTYEFYRRNFIEGLFLSSGIEWDADRTMEKMVNTAKILRERYGFYGYIHMKILPGASDNAVEEAIKIADRVSINLELPTQESLKKLAPQKDFSQMLLTICRINKIREDLLSWSSSLRIFGAKGGQSTQIIIGATPDTDRQILTLSDYLYSKLKLKRVYYSAYIPINHDESLPPIAKPPLVREHRLYQADWLIRFYGFRVEELFEEGKQNLSERFDPKLVWALRNLDFFPVEITKASLSEILRVPGIGPISARRIIKARRNGYISFEDLEKLGVVMKRAKYFITIRGKVYQGVDSNNLSNLESIFSGVRSLGDERDLFEYALG
ncbi:MAG: putative DNA modification/repair radical SAM protein [Candidatus Hydrogenedentes bacterium]|nr:putative DNA modification/repair radical SAM protein [Candidatus Hydrogenedentota bacterium]